MAQQIDAPPAPASLVLSGTTHGEFRSAQRSASIVSSRARRPTADGYSECRVPGKQLQSELSDFEVRRSHNELFLQTVACRRREASDEIHPGERQDALPAIILRAVLSADRSELSAGNRNAALLL
jgi:hypothetical protein